MQFYYGPSRIDGAPIVGLATGYTRTSKNPKTGPMVQTWILRADLAPLDALRTRADVSICGGCALRGSEHDPRLCYVNLAQAPTSVWRAWQRGGYPTPDLASAGLLLRGKDVRLGAYGDPAAIPLAVWDTLLEHASGWTGYTHQWRSPRLRDVLKYCQASCDSAADLERARGLGAGTFRVVAPGDALAADERWCPAAPEGGAYTTCQACQACSGQGQHIAIYAHGSRANQFVTLRRSSHG